ncbi:MAG TPA: ATP-binding cassette domain-containing protein [Gemmatimonadaceae bacterium]|nr:ATP-binding cassette domain-containing protein [Gemmatimonadaceae bacterium]
MLALRHATRRFGETVALDDVSLDVRAGERIALIGPSGAGKTTLLRVISETLRSTLADREIGYIDQALALADTLRVIHNVNAGRLGHWSSLRALASLVVPLERDRAHATLDRLGIVETIDAPTGQLSGGQRQRVAIARVLVQDPTIILADEPVSQLDPERARSVLTLLADRTLVVSLHRPELATEFCDRVVGLRAGRVRFDCPARDVTPALLSSLYAAAPP